jgi:ABC-type phosphate/phosphonate transport system substrate-binding protein
MQARIYTSLMAGVSDDHALSFTLPVVDLISREINYPINFEIAKGETAKELFEFGQAMDRGDFHLSIVWGLEYGWLRDRFPRLKPMAVTRHQTDSLRSQLMVHPDRDADDLAALKNSRLATYRRVPLMDRIYLATQVEKTGETVESYFREIREFDTAKEAIWAVRDHQFDCVIVNTMLYNRHIANRPMLKMRAVVLSEPFPQAVLIGRPDRVDALRAGLWRATQQSLERINESPEGRQGLEFWRQERFIVPAPAQFEPLVAERVAEYPFTVLAKLERAGRP